MTGHAKAVFLDRDGTLIEDREYLADPAGVRLLPGVRDALRRLEAAGYLLVLATNQSGIARGMFSERDYEAVNAAMFTALGIEFAAVRHCPHGPDDGCSCRKPRPGMILNAARELGIDLGASFMIGDSEGDALAGLAAGCRSILVGPGPAPFGAHLASNLPAAVRLLLALGFVKK